MFKKIFHRVSTAVIDGLTKLSPQDHSQFYFVSLLIIVGITMIGFFPLAGINGLFMKTLLVPICAGLLLIVIAIQSLKNGYFTLLDKKTSWVLLAFLVAMLVSSLFADAPRNALFGTLSEAPSFALLFSLVLIFYVAYASLKKFSNVLGLMLVMASVYAIAFLHIVIRLVFGANVLSFGFMNTLTASLLGSWTDFAFFSLLMVILSIICLEMGNFVRTAKWITFSVGILGLLGLFIANIGWIWVLAGAVLIVITIYVFSLAYWNSEKSVYDKGRSAPWYSLAAFIIVLVGFLFGSVIMMPLTNNRPLAYQEIYPNITATMQAGFSSIRTSPITGVGLSSFNHAWNKIKPASLSGTDSGSLEFTTGYSFVTTLLATTGILGILVVLALIVLIIMQYVLIFRRGFSDPGHRFTGVLVIAGSLLLSIVALLDYPGTGILVLSVVFLGALWNITHTDEEYHIVFVDKPKTSFIGISLIFVLIFIGGAFVYITIRQTASVFAYSSSLKAFNANSRQAGIAKLTNANELWATDFYNRALSNQALVEVQNINPDENVSKDALGREVQRVLSVGMSYADVSTKLDPKNYQNWVALGNVYTFMTQLQVNGAADRARDAYTTAVSLSPNDRTLDLLFANLAESQGNKEQAKTLVQQSIAALPTVDAYIWQYQRDIAAKDYVAAETHLLSAVQLKSNSAELLTELGTLYFATGKYTNATAAFERSLVLSRNQPVAFAYLGVAYEALGKTEQANQVFEFLRNQIPSAADSLITKVRAQKGVGISTSLETSIEGAVEIPTATTELKQ